MQTGLARSFKCFTSEYLKAEMDKLGIPCELVLGRNDPDAMINFFVKYLK